MSFVERLVEIAKGEIGVTEEPGNTGLPFERYAIQGEEPLAWCARFVRYCVEKAGGSLPGHRYKLAQVAFLEGQFIKKKWFHKTDPQVGDIVFYKTRKGSDAGFGRHVGIVVGVVNDRLLTTVEGNFGDKVTRRTQAKPWANVTGFGRLPDDGGAVN